MVQVQEPVPEKVLVLETLPAMVPEKAVRRFRSHRQQLTRPCMTCTLVIELQMVTFHLLGLTRPAYDKSSLIFYELFVKLITYVQFTEV